MSPRVELWLGGRATTTGPFVTRSEDLASGRVHPANEYMVFTHGPLAGEFVRLARAEDAYTEADVVWPRLIRRWATKHRRAS